MQVWCEWYDRSGAKLLTDIGPRFTSDGAAMAMADVLGIMTGSTCKGTFGPYEAMKSLVSSPMAYSEGGLQKVSASAHQSRMLARVITLHVNDQDVILTAS